MSFSHADWQVSKSLGKAVKSKRKGREISEKSVTLPVHKCNGSILPFSADQTFY